MKAVVLVGGEGTRLRPLTYSTPKPLLAIGNQPFLERQLEWLAAYDVDEVVLAIGYLPDAFIEHFPRGNYAGIELRYRVESEPLGTAGAIRFAAEGIDERIIVCNGDVLTTLDLGELVAFHEKVGAEATIALTHVDEPSAFGVVPTFPDGEVRGFVEKPPRGKAPTNWINAGTYVLEPSVLETVPPRLQVSIERTTFRRCWSVGAAACTRSRATPTGSTSAPRASTSKPTSTCSRARSAARLRPARSSGAPGSGSRATPGCTPTPA